MEFIKRKSVMLTDETHKKAKILSAETGVPIGEIVELLINGTSEKEILKLYEKASKQ